MMAMMQAHHVRGAAVVVVQDGEVRYLRGYGSSDRAGRRPYEPVGTVSNLFSVSKPITTLTILMAASELGLDLDKDVNSYLRSIKLESRPDGPVTLRRLLSHSAGLTDDFRNEVALTPTDVRSLRAHLERQPPGRHLPAGALLAYSNASINTAALVIEDAAGIPFADQVRARLLQPIGAEGISERWPAAALALGQVAQLHEGPVGEREIPFFLSNPFPAGGFVGTPADMGRIMLLLLESGRVGGRQIVPEAVVRAMLTPQMTAGPSFPAYGLGLRLHSMGGHRFVEHAGENRNAVMMLTDHRFGIYIATTRHNYAEALYPTFRGIASQLFDLPFDPPPRLRAADPEAYAYVGIYTDGRQVDGAVWRLGRSFARPDTAAARPQRLLSLDAQGVLLLDGQQFSQVGPQTFRAVEKRSTRTGELSWLKLDTLATGQMVFTLDIGGFVRMPWHEQPLVVRTILLILTGAMLAVLAIIMFRKRNWQILIPAGVATALALAFPSTVLFFFRNGDRFTVERSPEPMLLTVAPWFPASAAAAGILLAIHAWPRRETLSMLLAGVILLHVGAIWLFAFS